MIILKIKVVTLFFLIQLLFLSYAQGKIFYRKCCQNGRFTEYPDAIAQERKKTNCPETIIAYNSRFNLFNGKGKKKLDFKSL